MNLYTRIALTSAMLVAGTWAQSIMGTLTGTVADSSGAVIPQANVAIRNEASGDVRRTVTNSGGFFTFSALPAATYSLEVEVAGFAKWQDTGISLHSGDSKTIGVELHPATSVEQIQVTGAVTTLATIDSGEKSAVISARELQNLAIVGRDAAELIKILPGAAMVAHGGVNGQAYSGEVYGINGAGIGGNQGGLGGNNINGQAVDITMDGGHTYDPGAVGSATPVNPNVEMIQEIKVLTSNFAAENAKGPVVMNTVSKAGGTSFHGEGYLTARNAVLNSADWQNNYSDVPKPNSSYYFPGGNIGGPVLLPGTHFNKNHDKLFFFEGFEYYDQHIDGGVDRAFVPTVAERSGDFSQANMYGPLQSNLGAIPTGTNIVNGVIPASTIDPGAKILLNTYPVPNANPLTNNGFNYKSALLSQQNSWQSLSRIDYSVSDNTKAFVRYNAQRETQYSPNGLWQGTGADNMIPNPSNIASANGSDSWSASLTHVFSPTMTSETTFSYTHINFPNSPEDPSKLQRADTGFPYKGIYGTAQTDPSLLSWGGAFPDLGVAGYNFHPNMIAEKGIVTGGENFTKVFGSHMTKFGAYFEQVYNRQDNWAESEGVFEYEPWNTISGNIYADMLMGRGFSSYTEAAQTAPGNLGQRILDFYAQDAWKVTRRLTLEYGIRFEHLPQPWDKGGVGFAVFNAAAYSNDPSQVNAHSGLEWNAIDKNVPLSGVSSPALFYSPRFGLAFDVFGTGKTVLRGGWGMFRNPASVQSNGYTGPWTTAAGSQSYSCGFQQTGCLNWASIDQLKQSPNVPQGPGSGYTSINVMGTGPNTNEQPLTTSYSFSIDQSLPGRFLLETSYVGNHSKYGLEVPDTNAIPLFTPGVAGASNVNIYRPRLNYQSINETLYVAKSQYDSLQVSLRRNVGWLNLQANYTFSKSMGTQNVNGALTDYGLNYFWGVNPGNRPQVLSIAYTLNVPSFVHGNLLARGLANGWQVSGIFQAESGPDLIAQNANFNFSETNLSAQSSLNSPNAPLNPILLCNPTSNLKPGQYVNGACFGPPAVGQLGAGVFPYIPGPAFFSTDVGLYKNFVISERQKFQFRVSAFNLLNHPLTTFRSGDPNLYLTYNAAGVLQVPNFGFADYKTGHRVIELAVKYFF